ncbi:hypothetical protein PPTG_05387 [Phytophthora nicotianae INRA-310]|uniref:Uncharacterized protein n=1 Tax=Phytophthora nicotianae (strain INRA-310) TaxID=761204 RepID=W2QWX3_PHYN3|nr:hypothetical protein PPTG_05387 [Phytophthora nicotianae INRA-310]ETN17638.1 hypothetical protein PPTG_05387 [Phytophthora nicotianae INRA-310]
MLLPPANDYDELQAVLLDAGVPMDLVVQISNMSRDDEILLQPTGEVIPELRSPSNTSRAISGNGTVISEERDSRTNDEKDVTSPFESALRQYLEQSARERSMLEKIFATNISTSTVDVSSWQPPTNSPTDPANSNEITLYTFGTFFTQCLFCGGPDIQVTCIQMAERTAPLVKKVIGATCAFEGIVALIVVGIREAKTSQVFQTAIHLAYTVFLTETASTKKMSEHGEDEHCGGVSALNLIEEVACPNWSYGLRVILEWALGPTEESSSIPDIMTVNRAPTTLNCTPTATMGPRAATPTAANPPVSIPGNSALNRKQPEDIKQLVNTRSTDQPERRTGGVNGKSKEKVKSNSKHDGKDPDHCVVQ